MQNLRRTTFAFFLLSSLPACSREPRSAGTSSASAVLELSPPSTPAYAPGRWRLADAATLDKVVLWASHIVIRHREAKRTGPCFTLAQWSSEAAASKRSREDARALISDVRRRALAAPDQFAELAQQHSEDVATRSLGGSLGGVMASQLTVWPEVLDALARIRPGEISEVIETGYGFHILERHHPPVEASVTGERIVIAHDDAEWIAFLARAEVPRRSRAEAETLANDLYAQAQARPEAFGQLIERYSEHRDALRGGDMGTWSTREPTFYPREVEILARLAPGEIAPPIDSLTGFEIIRRTENRPRALFAMDQVRLFFDAHRPAPDPLAKSSVRARAQELARTIQRTPGTFSQLQRELCCTQAEQWLDGRGSPALTNALSRLELGGIAAEPIQSESSYVIPRRIEPTLAESASITHELPEPRSPQIEYFIASYDGGFSSKVFQKIAADIEAGAGWPAEASAQLVRLHRTEGHLDSIEDSEPRLQAFQAILTKVRQVLGPEQYPRYEQLLNTRWEEAILQGG